MHNSDDNIISTQLALDMLEQINADHSPVVVFNGIGKLFVGCAMSNLVATGNEITAANMEDSIDQFYNLIRKQTEWMLNNPALISQS